jgi:hypothetical protein
MAATGRNCRVHTPQRIRSPLNYLKGRADLKADFDYKVIERNNMKRIFLSGILCGVIMAAAVTFAIAIPANNMHWRTEIVKRGGATWYFDKNGHMGWMWTVEPISDRDQSAPAIPPRPRRASDPSSLERL